MKLKCNGVLKAMGSYADKIVGAAKKVVPPGSKRHHLVKSLLNRSGVRLPGTKHLPEEVFPAGQRFLPCAVGFCRKSDISRQKFGWMGVRCPAYALAVLPQRDLRIVLDVPDDEFSEVHILFATFDRRNTAKLRLRLREFGRKEILADSLVDTLAIRNNQYFEWHFPPITNSGGKHFEITLSSADASVENCVAVWGSVLEESSADFRHRIAKETLHEIAPGILVGRENYGLVVDPRRVNDPESESVFVPTYQCLAPLDDISKIKFGWEGRPFQTAPLAVSAEGVECTFECPTASIEAIRFRIATFGRQNDCRLVMEIRDYQNDLVLREKKLSTQSFVDDSFVTFRFEPLLDVLQRRLKVVLRSPDARADHQVAVWGTLAKRPQKRSEDRFVSYRDSYTAIIDHQAVPKIHGGVPSAFLAAGEFRRLSILFVVDENADMLGGLMADLVRTLQNAGVKYSIFFLRDYSEAPRDMLTADLIFFYQVRWTDKVFDLMRLLRRSQRLTIGIVDSPNMFLSSLQRSPVLAAVDDDERPRLESNAELLQATVSNCDCILTTNEELEALCEGLAVPSHVLPNLREFSPNIATTKLHSTVEAIISNYKRQRLPSFTLVSVLYGKEREIPYFMESLRRQSYPGDIEVIFVNDQTPDKSVEGAEKAHAEFEASGAPLGKRRMRVLHNEKNLGNCGSRNAAINVATGDVVVIVDADCLLNKDFLQAHANAYLAQDADVVVGYYNLETGSGDPMEALLALEHDPERVDREAELQDPINKCSFLNCITRNFSLRRSFLSQSLRGEQLFDELFAYSKNPASGFGWEDIEMGYRLYRAGARIKFAADAFSVHISHPSAVEERSKPLRSLLNFRRLLEKHPDIVCVSRRWVIETFDKICAWCDSFQHPKNDDRLYIEHHLSRYRANIPAIRTSRRLKILSYRWHCAHQYEIYKSGQEFVLLKGTGTTFTDRWYFEHRPQPDNAKFRFIEEINLNEFDMAILHFDENVLAPELCNGTLEREWGSSFKWFRENLKMPLVAVCHGTPQFYGQYKPNYAGADLLQVIEEERRRLVEYLGDVMVVCNSYQAEREWGFKNSKVIWHGFDPAEYPLSTYSKGLLSVGKSLMERPHYRGYPLFQATMQYLPEELHPDGPSVKSPSVLYFHATNEYGWAKFRNYVDNIRQYSVYFNPTLRSPMPRSRTEGMLCGLVSVSANNHDVDCFIKNGVNGFYSNEAEELADYLRFLAENTEAMRRMGLESRKTAIDIFNHDRFLAAWAQLMNELTTN